MQIQTYQKHIIKIMSIWQRIYFLMIAYCVIVGKRRPWKIMKIIWSLIFGRAQNQQMLNSKGPRNCKIFFPLRTWSKKITLSLIQSCHKHIITIKKSSNYKHIHLKILPMCIPFALHWYILSHTKTYRGYRFYIWR